jgi:hypothetical protein
MPCEAKHALVTDVDGTLLQDFFSHGANKVGRIIESHRNGEVSQTLGPALGVAKDLFFRVQPPKNGSLDCLKGIISLIKESGGDHRIIVPSARLESDRGVTEQRLWETGHLLFIDELLLNGFKGIEKFKSDIVKQEIQNGFSVTVWENDVRQAHVVAYENPEALIYLLSNFSNGIMRTRNNPYENLVVVKGFENLLVDFGARLNYGTT